MANALIELMTEQLMETFPNAFVQYKDGYWDVVHYESFGVLVESYKLKNGKLVRFATIETED